jgi:hypothetical protein
VDQVDYSIFQRSYGGEGNPAAESCAAG